MKSELDRLKAENERLRRVASGVLALAQTLVASVRPGPDEDDDPDTRWVYTAADVEPLRVLARKILKDEEPA